MIINNHIKNYEIIIDRSFEKLKQYICKHFSSDIKICIITDSNVGRIYLNEIKKLLVKYEVIHYILEAGEDSKNIDNYIKIQKFLLINNFNRKDLILALGGGVVGDISGFVASTYMRGISYIQIPTTLLSQVDSSIGGKTAVNIDYIKNIVGVFSVPDLVFINYKTLITLDIKQLMSGFNEVLKMTIIYDNNLFYDIKDKTIDKLTDEDYKKIIYNSLKIKKFFVESDFMEKNIRKYLNFGHTLGHAIEKEYYTDLTHGDCIAYGMKFAINLSYNRGYISINDYNTLINTIDKFIYNKNIIFNIEKILYNIKYDKKNDYNKINWILIDKIGSAIIKNDITGDEINEAIKKLF